MSLRAHFTRNYALYRTYDELYEGHRKLKERNTKLRDDILALENRHHCLSSNSDLIIANIILDHRKLTLFLAFKNWQLKRMGEVSASKIAQVKENLYPNNSQGDPLSVFPEFADCEICTSFIECYLDDAKIFPCGHLICLKCSILWNGLLGDAKTSEQPCPACCNETTPQKDPIHDNVH